MRRLCLYIKMAVQNLVSNRRFYLPYSLCCIGTAAMYYIMSDIATNETLTFERGAEYVRTMMGLGIFVLSVFSVFIICYANSFIIKRRRRELGLYNILGMEKQHIAILMLFETVLLGAGCILAGLAAGMLFSKLTLLILAQILRFGVPMGFTISLPGIVMTALQFGVIFLICLVVNVFQVLRSSPIELLHAVSKGEKEPKGRILLTLFGIATLGGGYALALSVKDPVSALVLFFVAVLLVIFGTFSLFTAGSIVILKLLRKNKRLYYRIGPFTAISGLIYRMKQNAVGMANICILSTMVLVTISTTVSLYSGMEDIIQTQYPFEIETSLNMRNVDTDEPASPELMEQFYHASVDTAESCAEVTDIKSFVNLSFTATRLQPGVFSVDTMNYVDTNLGSVISFGVIPVSDYNRMSGQSVTLAADEVLSYNNTGEHYDTIQLNDMQFSVAENLTEFPLNNREALVSMINSQYIVVADQSVVDAIYTMQCQAYAERASDMLYTIGLELEGDAETKIAAFEDVVSEISELMRENEFFNTLMLSRQTNYDDLYAMYGSFLFLGIFLGMVFTMAAVLIIYYKQVSEGYDDRERFVIMQKVGMDTRTVKKSIGTQVLMVFFLPLLVSGVHVLVAFPMVSRMMQLFALKNTGLFALCVIITFMVFAVVYVVVYLLTARTYYKIVGDYSRHPAAKPIGR